MFQISNIFKLVPKFNNFGEFCSSAKFTTSAVENTPPGLPRSTGLGFSELHGELTGLLLEVHRFKQRIISDSLLFQRPIFRNACASLRGFGSQPPHKKKVLNGLQKIYKALPQQIHGMNQTTEMTPGDSIQALNRKRKKSTHDIWNFPLPFTSTSTLDFHIPKPPEFTVNTWDPAYKVLYYMWKQC